MKITLRALPFAVLLTIIPMLADGAGGMQPKRNKDFRELIVRGERPEIAACLVAAIDYARHSTSFSNIRWTIDDSDQAILRESESNGRFIREIQLGVRMLERAPGLVLDEKWRPVHVSCEQQDDGVVHIDVQRDAG